MDISLHVHFLRLIIVGWQATQKCSFEYIIKKMDFFFTTFLFGA